MDFVGFDDDGKVVGKWRQHEEPQVDGVDIQQVDDVNNYDLDYWFDE